MSKRAPGNWTWFVGRRYVWAGRRDRRDVGSLLSIVGLALGVMTLTTVLSVMNGFQFQTIETILELNSYHLRLYPDGARDAGAAAAVAAAAAAVAAAPGVQTVTQIVQFQTLARGLFAEPQAAVVRGVQADLLAADPALRRIVTLDAGEFDLTVAGNVVVGSQLARNLGVRVGDPLHVVNLGGGRLSLREPAEVRLRVVGLFTTGFFEFDRTWLFVSLEDAVTTFQAGDDLVVAAKLSNRYADAAAMSAVYRALPAMPKTALESWRSYNSSIFGALRLEKTMMLFLVGLIFVVVGLNIYHALRRSVREREAEIGILKAMGAAPRAIRRIFVVEGLIIGLVGAGLGTLAGRLLSGHINSVLWAVERVGNTFVGLWGAVVAWFGGVGPAPVSFFSTSVYYIQKIPTEMVAGEFVGVALFAFASSVVAAYTACRAASLKRPIEVIRNE